MPRVELIARRTNPFLATVGLRGRAGADRARASTFRLEVELGSMPLAFFTPSRRRCATTLQQGLHGWQVTDCVVTMTHSGYWARQSHAHGTFDKSMSSTAGDFRNLTPLVLMAALRQAGTEVYEPIHRFRPRDPGGHARAALPALARLRAVPLDTERCGVVVRAGGRHARPPGCTSCSSSCRR